jgi:formate hydrogenlyase subunit 6/NADH:ubiquinone oxidoreductase subunit I
MSLLKDIWNAVTGIGKGMQITFDTQFDENFAEIYPFVQPNLPPTSVQSLALIQNEDGSDRCVSCLQCERVCPSQVITIERKRNPAGKGFILERFDIDLVNCMYCAACVEACPASAIVTIQDFELSTFNLQTLKADKDFLDLQGRAAPQWYSPKFGVEYRNPDASNLEHGKIVKAPLDQQPGGLEAMEKERAKAEAAVPKPVAAIAPAAPPSAAPKAAAPVVAAPVVGQSSTAPNGSYLNAEGKTRKPTKRFGAAPVAVLEAVNEAAAPVAEAVAPGAAVLAVAASATGDYVNPAGQTRKPTKRFVKGGE